MEPDEPNAEDRAFLATTHEEMKQHYRDKIDGWAVHFPEIEEGLNRHYERFCQDLDVRLARFDAGLRMSFGELVKSDELLAQELFALFESILPGLSAIESHDDLRDEIDRRIAQSNS